MIKHSSGKRCLGVGELHLSLDVCVAKLQPIWFVGRTTKWVTLVPCEKRLTRHCNNCL